MKLILSVLLIASSSAVQHHHSMKTISYSVTPQNPDKEEKARALRFEAANEEDGLIHEEDGELIEPYTGKVVEADLDGSLWDVQSG